MQETTAHRRRWPILVPVAAAGAAVLAATVGTGGSSAHQAVQSAPAAAQAQIQVGLITKTDTNPFFVKMKQGAQKAASAAGVKLLTAAGKFDGDNAGQVTAIENMMSAGVKGILITPSDTKAIVPTIKKARAKGIVVIALDTPTAPQNATDALYATNNFNAGLLIGKYTKAKMAGKTLKIATLDLKPGITVGILRHNGFLAGLGDKVSATATSFAKDSRVVCSQDTQGDQAKGQTAMENCLQKSPDINVLYTINEPAALGAYTALKAAGKEGNVMIVSVDGGCTGVKAVQDGKIAATSQQYPLKMASQGVDAVVAYAQNSSDKASGYTDTGVNLITANPQAGMDSKDVQFGLANCWG